MTSSEVKSYSPEQLANAERMIEALSALPEEKQKTVTMITNAFMEGMKAQERFASGMGSLEDMSA